MSRWILDGYKGRNEKFLDSFFKKGDGWLLPAKIRANRKLEGNHQVEAVFYDASLVSMANRIFPSYIEGKCVARIEFGFLKKRTWIRARFDEHPTHVGVYAEMRAMRNCGEPTFRRGREGFWIKDATPDLVEEAFRCAEFDTCIGY